MSQQKDETASFGFAEVKAEDKAGMVREVFSSVAPRYDLMNDLMSAGVHRLWKDIFVTMVNPQPGWRIIDVAGGTGDIAFRMARRVQAKGGEARITICDINPEMLTAGKARPEAAQFSDIEWVCADAENMPLASGEADAYTIAFGIRNVTHIDKVLSEAYRLLKPGGRFLCLEFSRVDTPVLDRLYDLYSFQVLPRLGEAVAGDGPAYRYLAESIRRFPPQAQFQRMIEKAGFQRVSYRNLAFGIAAIHSGWKI